MSEELIPCQCGGEAVDRGHGIECLRCGIWLGNGTTATSLGGYVKAWNTRAEKKYKWSSFHEWWVELPYMMQKLLQGADIAKSIFNAAREKA